MTLYRTLAGYPEPLRSEFTRSIFAYTQSVIQIAWPAQRRGEVTEKGTEILFSVGRRVLEFEPTTSGQSIVQCGGSERLQHLGRIAAAAYLKRQPMPSPLLFGSWSSSVPPFQFLHRTSSTLRVCWHNRY